MGGSDQWGNIVNGVELGRRVDGAELYGLTSPLLTTSGGQKMGKTADGAIWLNSDRLSAYDYWQFWRNTADDDVGRFLKLFTELPLEEIARLEGLEGQEINEAKMVLANEATAMAHGRAAAEAAAETARRAFVEGQAAEGLPVIELPAADLEAGIGILDAFVRSDLAKSNSEARKLIQNGGARLNDEKLNDPKGTLSRSDLINDGAAKLSAGKKKHVLVRAS